MKPLNHQLVSCQKAHMGIKGSGRPGEQTQAKDNMRDGAPSGKWRQRAHSSKLNQKVRTEIIEDMKRANIPQAKEVNAFDKDSTFLLIKKYCIYKMMGSNFFINYSLGGMKVAYGILGKVITNWIIEASAGSIFTGGVTLRDLKYSTKGLEKSKVGGIGMYVAEGLENPSKDDLDQFADFSINSIE